MRQSSFPWALVLILVCCTSVLSYRQYHSPQEYIELQERHMELSAKVVETHTIAEKAYNQSMTNTSSIAIVMIGVDIVNNKLNGLIDKLSTILPGGAYIAPPEPVELNEFNPRVIAPEIYNEDDYAPPIELESTFLLEPS